MTWSIPIFPIGRLWVRLHALMLAYVLVVLVRAISQNLSMPAVEVLLLAAWPLAGMLLAVALLEMTRVVVCRALGGTVVEVILWPLGGLGAMDPPRRWRAHLVVSLVGLCVLGLLFLSGALFLWINVDPPFSAFPFQDPRMGLKVNGLEPAWLYPVFAMHRAVFFILLANLLPLLPFAGGSIMHALLWPRLGDAGALRAVAGVGLVLAIGLGLAGAVFVAVGSPFGGSAGSVELLCMAVVGGLVSATTGSRVEWTNSELGEDPFELDELDAPLEVAVLEIDDTLDEVSIGVDEVRVEVSEESSLDSPGEAERTVDRILEKIADHGIASLSEREREDLRAATERRRQKDR